MENDSPRKEYDQLAEIYDQIFCPDLDNDLLITSLSNFLYSNYNMKKIFEVGVGTGNIIYNLNKLNKNFELYGCDISPKMIEKAKEKCPTGNFYEEDVNYFDFQYYDTVVAVGGIFLRLSYENKLNFLKKFTKNNTKLILGVRGFNNEPYNYNWTNSKDTKEYYRHNAKIKETITWENYNIELKTTEFTVNEKTITRYYKNYRISIDDTKDILNNLRLKFELKNPKETGYYENLFIIN